MQPCVLTSFLRLQHPTSIICIPYYITEYFVYIFHHCAFEFSSKFIKQLNNRSPFYMTVVFRNLFNIFANQFLDIIKLLQPL